MAKRNKIKSSYSKDSEDSPDTFTPVLDDVKEVISPIIDLGGEYSKPAEETPFVDINFDTETPPSFAEASTEGNRKRRPYKKRNTDPDNPVPFIDGEILLMFLDLIIPMGITMSNNWVTGEKMSPDDLMLTEKQKSQLKKLADKVANKIDINVNPILALTLGMGTIYTGNFIAAKNKKTSL